MKVTFEIVWFSIKGPERMSSKLVITHDIDRDKETSAAAHCDICFCGKKTFEKNKRMGNCLIKKFVAKEDVFDTGTRLGRVRVPSQQIAQDLNNQLSCWQKCKLFCCFCQNRNLFKWIVAYPRSTTDKFVKKTVNLLSWNINWLIWN